MLQGRPAQRRVQRHRHRAEPGAAEEEVDERIAIVGEDGHAVARLDALRVERGRATRGAEAQLRVRARGRLRPEELPVPVALGPPLEQARPKGCVSVMLWRPTFSALGQLYIWPRLRITPASIAIATVKGLNVDPSS